MKTRFLIIPMFFLVAMPVFAGDSIKIENNSFGVIRESQADITSGLILFIQNRNCIANYRVSIDEVILGEGEVNVKVVKRYIPFGNQVLQMNCGTLDSITIERDI